LFLKGTVESDIIITLIFYSVPSVVREIKSRKMRWAELITNIGGQENRGRRPQRSRSEEIKAELEE
jgi:hypothetical protein